MKVTELQLLTMVLDVYNSISHGDDIEPIAGSLRLTGMEVEDPQLGALLFGLADIAGDDCDIEDDVVPFLACRADLINRLVERVDDEIEERFRQARREDEPHE